MPAQTYAFLTQSREDAESFFAALCVFPTSRQKEDDSILSQIVGSVSKTKKMSVNERQFVVQKSELLRIPQFDCLLSYSLPPRLCR